LFYRKLPIKAKQEPISDYDTLWRLGKKMRNCISDMALKIVAGHYYVYQIYEPYCVTIGVNIINPAINNIAYAA